MKATWCGSTGPRELGNGRDELWRMNSTTEYYVRLDREIGSLLTLLAGVLVGNDVQASQDYLDHGEYELALDRLVWSITANRIAVTCDIVRRIEMLADEMQIDQDEFGITKLRNIVIKPGDAQGDSSSGP